MPLIFFSPLFDRKDINPVTIVCLIMFHWVLFLVSDLAMGQETDLTQLDKLIINSSDLDSKSDFDVSNVINGDELQLNTASTIGETLKNIPGISTQSFGPGVGQPMMRGQTGSRTQVLQNSLGSVDVTSFSPDHANSTGAIGADQIEILKGPATLLYSSGAMGGVVNVIDHRIPDAIPENIITGSIEQRYNTVNEGKTSSFKLDMGENHVAWHLDGYFRDSISIQIPGAAIDDLEHPEDEGSSDEQTNSSGRLPNTATRSLSGTAGFSLIGEQGMIGVSVNHLDNHYGIPPNGHQHELHEENFDHELTESEKIEIDLEQTRYDFKAEINTPFALIDKASFRLGYNDYRHDELENGQRATKYTNKGFVGRIEFEHSPWFFFDRGVSGFQSQHSDFAAFGEEVIVPESEIEKYALFSVQNVDLGNFSYHFGLRIEQQFIHPDNGNTVSHTPVNGSAAIDWKFTSNEKISLSFTRSERAPDVQELFANGAHFATRSFDIGNPDLKVEIGHILELNFRIEREWLSGNVSLYQNWTQDYIFQQANGSTIEDLTVFNTVQRDAEFQGFEAQLIFPLTRTNYGQFDLEFFGDYVRGQFNNGEDVPRLPPLKYGLALSISADHWFNQLKMTRAEKQNHAGLNEAETDGYWQLDFMSSYRFALTKNTELFMFVKGSNLMNQEIRNSTSYLRQIAPEAARGFEFGLSLEF